MAEGWSAESFRLWATIDGKEVEVVRASGRTPMNDIPRASLVLALGRRTDTLRPAAIHGMLNDLKVKRKVKVFLQAKNLTFFGARQIQIWPKEPMLLFEGYTTGQGYSRSGNSAEYTLECEHWVADLAYASSVSAVSSPENPSQMTFPALTANPADTADGVAKSGGFTGLSQGEQFITSENIAADFWGKALQPWMTSLTKLEEFAASTSNEQLGLDLSSEEASGNKPAFDALERFEPRPDDKHTYGVALSFDPEGYDGDLAIVAGQISVALGAETLDMMAGSTLWDKLIQYASTFMLAVVPMVDRVLVVPFIPGLRTPWADILASDYEYCRLSGDSSRVLRAVGIYGGRGVLAGGEFSGGDALDYDQFSIGGFFQGASTGQIKFKQCPMWMTDCTRYSESAATTGAANATPVVPPPVGPVPGSTAEINTISTVLNPGVGPAAKPNANPVTQAEDNTILMNKYAEAMYVYEVNKFRSGDLSGKFRTDIGPGSIVRIEGCGEKFLGGSDQFGQELFGTVLQVDWVLDSEKPTATTAFHIAHLRNKLENETPGFSLDRHPLWATPWKGCPLIAKV